MRLIRPLKTFFAGSTLHPAGGAPFEIDPIRAQDLVAQGLAEFVVAIDLPLIETTTDPAPVRAERAVSRRQK